MSVPGIASPESIPASAHCVYGPERWTMLHPRRERLELAFPFIADTSVAGWRVLTAIFVTFFALYLWASYWILWGEFAWARIEVFVIVSAIFFGSVWAKYPFSQMVIQELVVDRSMALIMAKGLVRGRSVVVKIPIAAVTEVRYMDGSTLSQSPRGAEIDIDLAAPHRKMRFPELAPHEGELCNWLCIMLDQPLAAR